MDFEDWVYRIWQQVSLLDAEHEMLTQELARVRKSQGDCSEQAQTLARQLEEIEERLLHLDEQYAVLLRRSGWGKQ